MSVYCVAQINLSEQGVERRTPLPTTPVSKYPMNFLTSSATHDLFLLGFRRGE